MAFPPLVLIIVPKTVIFPTCRKSYNKIILMDDKTIQVLLTFLENHATVCFYNQEVTYFSLHKYQYQYKYNINDIYRSV